MRLANPIAGFVDNTFQDGDTWKFELDTSGSGDLVVFWVDTSTNGGKKIKKTVTDAIGKKVVVTWKYDRPRQATDVDPV